jgi:hypothetical protein
MNHSLTYRAVLSAIAVTLSPMISSVARANTDLSPQMRQVRHELLIQETTTVRRQLERASEIASRDASLWDLVPIKIIGCHAVLGWDLRHWNRGSAVREVENLAEKPLESVAVQYLSQLLKQKKTLNSDLESELKSLQSELDRLNQIQSKRAQKLRQLLKQSPVNQELVARLDQKFNETEVQQASPLRKKIAVLQEIL